MERNLLQEIFSELNAEYSELHWQLDVVDLRWGISQEAGLENKTMQICKEELKHCQQMSPKPNFIILSGDRYGWIPLPEVVPTSIYETLQMTNHEKYIFDHWYELDKNYLPDGAYIMKSRMYSEDFEYDIFTDKLLCVNYADDGIWKNEVEDPLSVMFKRNNCKLYETSATEQEIELGALCVDDAHEHVIAYIRHLQGVPEDKQEIFLEFDKKEKILSLENRIKDKLSNDNIISVEVDYKQYMSYEYAATFKEKMKKRLCDIINNVIAENKQEAAVSENQIHIEYALQESSEFIGREKELEYIKGYVDSRNIDYGLWYQAPSGMGKSALLSKVVELYKEDYDVICRFCGTSELSSDAESLFSSLYMDLWNLSDKRKQKYDDILDRRFKEYRIDRFSQFLSNASFAKPLLIVIDSLDRVDDFDWQDFSTLQWLNHNGRKDIKIIISSIPDLKYRIELPFLRKIELGNLSSDALILITSQLKLENRTLCDEQMKQLSTIIEKSDNSPLYLKTLGRILSRIDSQQDLSKIPYKLEELVKYYCMQLAAPERHGQLLVSHITFWLATVYTGVVEKEIAEMLAFDKVYLKHLAAQSKHELNTCEDGVIIPPIVWTRLRYDLMPLIRQENKFKIQLIAFFHPRIKLAILDMFNDMQAESEYLYVLLYRYYISKYPDRHALLEGPHYLLNVYRRKLISQEEFLQHMEGNLDFIVYKKVNFPRQLLEDYDRAIYSTQEQEIRKRIKIVKDNIHSIKGCYTPQDVKMTLRNMPLSSSLRAAMEQTKDVSYYMEDTLSYTPLEESIYVISGIGKSPVMSQDGKVVASLKDNCYKIDVEYLEEYNKGYYWSFPIPLIEIQMDDDATCIAARAENKCFLLDLKKKTVVYRSDIDKNTWMSLSGNGCLLLIGDTTGNVKQYDVANGQILRYQNILHAKLSPSGRYIWFINKVSYTLNRYDLNTKRIITFTVLPVKQYGESSSIDKEELRIVSCSDECCIAGNLFVEHYISNDGKDKSNPFLIPEAVNLPMQHPSMFIHREVPMWIDSSATCVYVDNHSLYSLGNTVLNELQCINGDFTIALSATQGRIFEFKKEIQKFKCTRADKMLNITGFNLSVSNDGTQIAVSSYGGHGPLGERNLLMLRVSNGQPYSWSPIPEQKRDYMSLPANAISPDGKMLAVTVYTGNEIYIVDTENNNVICKYNLPCNVNFDENIGRMKFTEDAEYLMILTGNFITPVDGSGPNVLVCDINRNKFIEIITDNRHKKYKDSDISYYYDNIISSPCNRYLFLESSIFDIIGDEFLVEGDYDKKCFEIISPSTPDVYAGTNHYNLKTHKLETIENNNYLSAISPSGLYYYYIENRKLYMAKLQDNKSAKYLRDDVVKVYPALDDRYIYILDTFAHYILFDTLVCQDLQVATKGLVEHTGKLGIKVCAQGLVVLNSDTSMLSLFKPDEKYKVNQPAFTSFVRRWDLITKVRREPTAVCPICGKMMEYKKFLSCGLKEYAPNRVDSSDWDNPKLKNHHCPHCNAEIQFTPYII